MKNIFVIIFCLICLSRVSHAQTTFLPQYQTAPYVNTSVSLSTPLPVRVYGGTNGQCLVSNGTYGVFTTCGGGGGTPGGSVNQVQFNSAGAFGGASNVYIGTTGANLGIGTSTVLNLLDVSGAAAIGTSYAGIIAAPTNGLIVQGDVGIGTSASTSALSVVATGTTAPTVIVTGAGASQSGNLQTWSNNGIGASVNATLGATFNQLVTFGSVIGVVLGNQAFITAGNQGGIAWSTSSNAGGGPFDTFVNRNKANTVGIGTTNTAGDFNGALVAANIAIGTNTISGGPLTVVGLTTGTNADTVCISSSGVILVQASSCTISKRAFKENIYDLNDSALDEIMAFRPVQFNMRKFKDSNGNVLENMDKNFNHTQIGFIAEDVAQIDPRVTTYEQDEKTPKSWDERKFVALLTKAVQVQQHEIDAITPGVFPFHRCFFGVLVCAN